MAKIKEVEFIWKDRKRILGMPISFTKYGISQDRLVTESGIFSINQEEILLYRIVDISLRINLMQRIFGVGSIEVHSGDKTQPCCIVKNVKRPREVKEILHKNVEKQKMERRVRATELFDDGEDCEHID